MASSGSSSSSSLSGAESESIFGSLPPLIPCPSTSSFDLESLVCTESMPCSSLSSSTSSVPWPHPTSTITYTGNKAPLSTQFTTPTTSSATKTYQDKPRRLTRSPSPDRKAPATPMNSPLLKPRKPSASASSCSSLSLSTSTSSCRRQVSTVLAQRSDTILGLLTAASSTPQPDMVLVDKETLLTHKLYVNERKVRGKMSDRTITRFVKYLPLVIPDVAAFIELFNVNTIIAGPTIHNIMTGLNDMRYLPRADVHIITTNAAPVKQFLAGNSYELTELSKRSIHKSPITVESYHSTAAGNSFVPVHVFITAKSADFTSAIINAFGRGYNKYYNGGISEILEFEYQSQGIYPQER